MCLGCLCICCGVSMQKNEACNNLKLDEKLLKMPVMNHPFVVSPPQHIRKIFQEYEKLAGAKGILLLQYFTGNGDVALRVCPDPFMREVSGRVEIVSFNHFRNKKWSYLGCKIYSLRYLPMIDEEGYELSAEAKANRISFYFALSKTLSFSSESANYAKIACALSGRRIEQVKKSHLREFLRRIFQ